MPLTLLEQSIFDAVYGNDLFGGPTTGDDIIAGTIGGR